MSRPRLYFAHANGLPPPCYRRLLAVLSAHFRIEAARRLGHQPAYPVADGWRALTDEVLDAIAAGGSEPAIGVGHSLGGVLLLRAAARQPRRFRAVVLLDPPLVYGPRTLALAAAKRLGLADRFTPAGRSRGRRVQWPDIDTAIAQLGKRPLFADFDDEALLDYLLGATRPRPEGGIELAFERELEAEIFRTLPHDLHREPAPIRVPGGLVRFAASDVVHPGDGARLARAHSLRQSRIAGDHLAPIARPHAVATHLLALLCALLGGHSDSAAEPDGQRV